MIYTYHSFSPILNTKHYIMTKPEYVKIMPLTGGMSNNTSLVRLLNEDKDLCVFKEFGFMSDFFVDKNNLFKCTKRIYDSGFGPDVLYCDDSCFFGMFVPGEVYETLDSSKYSKVITSLKNMHTRCSIEGIRSIDPIKVLDKYAAELSSLNLKKRKINSLVNILSENLVEANTALLDVTCVSHRSDKDVLCHGDAQASNIVFLEDSSDVKFIDCEFSGVADPVLDLAALTNRQTEFNMDEILYQYFGDVDKSYQNELRKRFVAYKIYSDMQWALLALIKFLSSDCELDSLYDIAIKYIDDASTWIGVYKNFSHLY